MPHDCCHFPGPQPTPCLTVSLTLTLPPAPREGSFLFGHRSSRWRLGDVLVHFPSATPKQSTLVFVSESISSRTSAYPSQVMQRAAASRAPVPLQSSSCECCPAPQLQPPPRHSSSTQLSPGNTYLPTLPAKLLLTVTTPKQVSQMILIMWYVIARKTNNPNLDVRSFVTISRLPLGADALLAI